MSPLPYVVTISDGVSMRTLHGSAFGPDRPALEAIIRRAVSAPDVVGIAHDKPTPNAGNPGIQSASPAVSPTMIQREIATASGYTGNACQSCGSFAMKRSGTCETCDGCGSTSGGCS